MPSLSHADTASTAVVMWLAYCSNKTRTAPECVQKTLEVIASAQDGEENIVAGWIGHQINSATLNRGNDADFLSALFVIDNKELALGCLDAAISVYTRGVVSLDPQRYFDDYISRYGEDRACMVSKLQYLTMYPNYADNVEEVERIMTALSTPAEVKESV